VKRKLRVPQNHAQETLSPKLAADFETRAHPRTLDHSKDFFSGELI
jgi:hypothetical protein